MKINERLVVFTVLLVVLATGCKYLFGPSLEWSGFSPVIAIALFSGFIVKQKDFSFLWPLLALFVSDAVIQVLYSRGMFPYEGFYDGQWKNYLILLSAALMGWFLKGKNYSSLFLGAFAAPTVFFLLSNFSVWLAAGTAYSRDFNGLMTCYAAGLPFYKNALMATVVFLPAILLLYNYLTRRKAALIMA
jgi:hypothetical protein